MLAPISARYLHQVRRRVRSSLVGYPSYPAALYVERGADRASRRIG